MKTANRLVRNDAVSKDAALKDAVPARAGVRIAVSVLVAVGLIAASCSSDPTPPEVVGGPTLLSPLQTSPGEAVMNTIEIDGTSLTFSFFVPPGFGPQTSVPVLLALPPGSQNDGTVLETMQTVYLSEAAKRGWVVVSPIAPDGVKFFEGSESLIPALMDAVAVLATPEGGRPHLAGISNGGISAFRIAADSPDDYASITVFPGFPRSSDDVDALSDLTDIPITMFVGETDGVWVDQAEDTVARLTELGGDITYEVVPGAGHVLPSLWQGTRLWDAFATARLSAS